MGSQPASGEESSTDASPSQPERIIFMIGDGMGAPAMTAGTYARGAPLRMLSMERLGFVTTHSYEYVTTDSAASATAFATGQKTHYEGLSVEPGTTRSQQDDPDHHLRTALEVAERRGWKTGLVSTSRVVHATPAAFASHRAHRHAYDGIAADIADSGVDVLLGGGRQHFEHRSDGRDLLEDFEQSGYRVAETADEIRAASGVADRLVGLPHESYLPPAGSGERAMSLPQMTREAIEVLDRNNDEGFFLMVEGSQIDWAEHDLDGPQTVAETRDFDRAVGVALEYARRRDDTLVVTTADHETGGLTVLDSEEAERHVRTLGGSETTEALVDYPKGVDTSDTAVPKAVPRVDVERNEDADETFGIELLADESFVPSFGHLSLASRPHTGGPDDFWSTHTPEMVPIWAEGPGADWMTAASDNAEVGRHLKALVQEESTPAHSESSRSPDSNTRAPRNVVLMIGEGAGFDAWTAGYYTRGDLEVRDVPARGLVSTHGRLALTNGEAAAATALAVGARTSSGRLGRIPDGEGFESKRTVLERAEARGVETGLVTDGSLFNPTLAAMYAHGRTKHSIRDASIANRAMSSGDRAEAFVTLPERIEGADGIELAYGGAESLDASLREQLSLQGMAIEEGWSEIASANGRHLRALDSPRPGVQSPPDGEAAPPTLAERTRTALDKLSESERGFFLVVESEGIGTAQEQLARDERVVEEVEAFDRAVGVARDFARRQGRTLVIATADRDYSMSTLDNHYGFSEDVCGAADRCGGETELIELSVAAGGIENGGGLSDATLQGEYAPPRLFLQYAWLVQAAARESKARGTATANFVPVFAEGPWSNRLEGFVDQPEMGQLLMEWSRSKRPPK
jgi:alkaline phosphatase